MLPWNVIRLKASKPGKGVQLPARRWQQSARSGRWYKLSCGHSCVRFAQAADRLVSTRAAASSVIAANGKLRDV